MNQFLSGVDRSSLIKGTAIYLIIYAVVNACGGIAFGLLGGLSAGVGIFGSATEELSNSPEVAEATSALAVVGGLAVVLGILYLISVPVFAVAAWGLWKRKTWARMAAIIALGFSLVLSVLTISSGITSIIWILISGFGIYLYWTDAGIKQELTQ